jgi:hypothetical protein
MHALQEATGETVNLVAVLEAETVCLVSLARLVHTVNLNRQMMCLRRARAGHGASRSPVKN